MTTGTERKEGNQILTGRTDSGDLIPPATQTGPYPGILNEGKETSDSNRSGQSSPGKGTTRSGTAMKKMTASLLFTATEEGSKGRGFRKAGNSRPGIYTFRRRNPAVIIRSVNQRMNSAAPGGENAQGLKGPNQMPPARAHQRMMEQPGLTNILHMQGYVQGVKPMI